MTWSCIIFTKMTSHSWRWVFADNSQRYSMNHPFSFLCTHGFAEAWYGLCIYIIQWGKTDYTFIEHDIGCIIDDNIVWPRCTVQTIKQIYPRRISFMSQLAEKQSIEYFMDYWYLTFDPPYWPWWQNFPDTSPTNLTALTFHAPKDNFKSQIKQSSSLYNFKAYTKGLFKYPNISVPSIS